MAETPELGGMAALAASVVALARGLEFVIQKFRSSPDAPLISKHSDRLAQLETKMAVVESRGPVNDARFDEVLRRLERLDEKLDRTLQLSGIKSRGEF